MVPVIPVVLALKAQDKVAQDKVAQGIKAPGNRAVRVTLAAPGSSLALPPRPSQSRSPNARDASSSAY